MKNFIIKLEKLIPYLFKKSWFTWHCKWQKHCSKFRLSSVPSVAGLLSLYFKHTFHKYLMYHSQGFYISLWLVAWRFYASWKSQHRQWLGWLEHQIAGREVSLNICWILLPLSSVPRICWVRSILYQHTWVSEWTSCMLILVTLGLEKVSGKIGYC